MGVRALLVDRWRKARMLFVIRYGIAFHQYGDRILDYPLGVSLKMLGSRLVFLSQLPMLLPDRHFLASPLGARLYVKLFYNPFCMDTALGVYEYSKTQLLYGLVKKGMTIVDIGAFEGLHSILFAKLMGDTGRVLAFEPDPENCEWLRRNIVANQCKCVDLHQYAIADTEGSSIFYPSLGTGSIVSRSTWEAHQREAIAVRTRRLDDVLSELSIDHIDVIKIDVEGADLKVLRGAEQTLRRSRAHLVMDVDVCTDGERRELFELLCSYGYTIYRNGKELRRIERADELSVPPYLPMRHVIREIYATKSSGDHVVMSTSYPKAPVGSH